MAAHERTIDIDMLDALGTEWSTADALQAKLLELHRKRGFTLPVSGPDALACVYLCLVSFQDEGWVEVSERIHNGNPTEYRLSPTGRLKKAQVLGQ